MKITVLGIVFSLMSINALAQQTPLLSHYYYNPYLINPAMAGQSKETRAFLFYRQQWVGMSGAPQTQAITVSPAVGVVTISQVHTYRWSFLLGMI